MEHLTAEEPELPPFCIIKSRIKTRLKKNNNRGGVYERYCSQPPEGAWDVLASLLRVSIFTCSHCFFLRIPSSLTNYLVMEISGLSIGCHLLLQYVHCIGQCPQRNGNRSSRLIKLSVTCVSVCTVSPESSLFISRFSTDTTVRLYLEVNNKKKKNDTGILVSTFNGSCVTEQ